MHRSSPPVRIYFACVPCLLPRCLAAVFLSLKLAWAIITIAKSVRFALFDCLDFMDETDIERGKKRRREREINLCNPGSFACFGLSLQIGFAVGCLT